MVNDQYRSVAQQLTKAFYTVSAKHESRAPLCLSTTFRSVHLLLLAGHVRCAFFSRVSANPIANKLPNF
jgi:hypothetical protein